MRKEASIEKWKNLYEIATEIKEMKPWEYFWDMDIINLTDEDAYISILGHGGETYGISVYEGEKGFDKFKMLAAQQELNISPQMAMYMQDNLTLYLGDREELSKKQRDIIKELGYKYRGKNQWLYFMSFKTNYMPYNFDSEEVDRMTVYLSKLKNALNLYFKEKPDIDFEQGYTLCYSDKKNRITTKKIDCYDFGFNGIQMADDVDLVNDLKKIPKTLGTLEIDILPMFITINDKAYDRPANPSMCMIVDKESGMVMSSEMSTPETGVFGNFANTVISTFFRYGLPKRMNICNSISGALLKKLCGILDIELEFKNYLPALEEAGESMMRFMG